MITGSDKKAEKAENDRLLYEATMDLANFLMNYGFAPKEAVEVAEDFWKKYKSKLTRSIWG
jgi:DNA primase large subunit